MTMIKKYTFGLFAVAVALLNGCTNEMDEPIMQDENIRITSLDINTGGVLTRADENGYDGIVKTTWAANDELALTINDCSYKAEYYFVDESDKGWKILNTDGTPVSDGIVFTKLQMAEGIDVRASYSKSGIDAAYNDVLLAEVTDKNSICGTVSFVAKENNPSEFTLVLELEHTKSYITVNLTNNITGNVVHNVSLYLRDTGGTAISTPITMKANSEMTTFECFAEAAYIEKFVVTMQKSDNSTYKVTVVPTYGEDDKGFAIQTNYRYPFNITLNPSDQTKGFSGEDKGYGVIEIR